MRWSKYSLLVFHIQGHVTENYALYYTYQETNILAMALGRDLSVYYDSCRTTSSLKIN